MLTDRDARAALVAAYRQAGVEPTIGELQGAQGIWRLDGYPSIPSAEWGAASLLASLYASEPMQHALLFADAGLIAQALQDEGRLGIEPAALYAARLVLAVRQLAAVLGEQAIVDVSMPTDGPAGPWPPPATPTGTPATPTEPDARREASGSGLLAGVVLGTIVTWIFARAIGSRTNA